MIWELRVASKDKSNLKGQELLAEIKRTLSIKFIRQIRTVKIYRLEDISKNNLQKLISNLLVEKIDQKFSVNEPLYKGLQTIEVAYKPGVMNPEVGSILKSAKDLKIKLKGADSSWEYSFFPKVTTSDLQKIVRRLLVNETIEHVVTSKPKTLLISAKPQKLKPLRSEA